MQSVVQGQCRSGERAARMMVWEEGGRPAPVLREVPRPPYWKRGVSVPPPGYAVPLSVGLACSETACFSISLKP